MCLPSFSCLSTRTYDTIADSDALPPPISLLPRPISYDAYMVTVNQKREERRILYEQKKRYAQRVERTQ